MTNWEVDWTHPGNTGSKLLAKNPKSHIKSGREWHMVSAGYLRSVGVHTPEYRADSWEVDWNTRNGKLVWARNLRSKMPNARVWHWVDFHTLERAGIKWKPANETNGRSISSRGYWVLTRRGMTEEEIELAHKHDLFLGKRKTHVQEHRLVAVKKYGYAPEVVRHLNGVKTDNRFENLVAGTVAENTADHNTARVDAMYWRERYERAVKRIEELENRFSE